MHATTLRNALANYVLYHDIGADTRKWYGRIVSVYCGWAGGDVLLEQFTGEAISRCIADKQALGRSPYYLRSLRNGLVAILHEVRGNEPIERVRSVKCPPLDPDAWLPHEVERLIHVGCADMADASRWRWQLVIPCGYYLGLDRCDLERLQQANFRDDGALVNFRRSKTGGAPMGGIPPDLLESIRRRCPAKGPILRMGISPEWFRKVFAGIVQRAGLHGTFKKLRKSSGSLVENDEPGKGHKHLGNTRAIFEKHYEAKKITRGEPTLPPRIRLAS